MPEHVASHHQIEIIPAIMASGRAELDAAVARVTQLAPLVQIDVMDGVFVPKRSWPYGQFGTDYAPDFLKILSEDDGLPLWQEMDYEIDLMVAKPEDAVERWIIAGAKRLIFHIEHGDVSIAPLVDELRKRFPMGITDSLINLEIGLAIGVDTPLEKLAPYLMEGNQKIDFVQCMGIAKVGFQGQPFDERASAQISGLRKMYPHLIISVDGGVNADTAGKLVKAGADRLVCGSALFDAANITEAFDDICDVADAVQHSSGIIEESDVRTQ